MKKVIKNLKNVKSFLDKAYQFSHDEGVDNKPLKERIDMLVEAISELKRLETPRWIPYKNLTDALQDMDDAISAIEEVTFRGRDNEKRIETAIDRIECAKGAVETLIPLPLPRWETPEQWEKHMGKQWKGAVYFNIFPNRDNKPFYENGAYQVSSTENIVETIRLVTKIMGLFDFTAIVICATEAVPPPDGWRPEK
jgi:hypothetical protein